jgi:hypothetical protein
MSFADQLGDMYWPVVIGGPILVLVLVLQIVLRARTKTKQLKQVFRSGSIVTDRSAPTHGPVAFGLACGAHMAINQGVAWNDLSGGGFTKMELRQMLAEMWQVNNAADWRQVITDLLVPHGEGPLEMAVDLRSRAGGAPDLVAWHRILQQAGASASAFAAAERISQYEDRFRADGLLQGSVRSLRAYDWGRAVNMARWGSRAGYCDQASAERAVVQAGELCAGQYGSWADLSAGFGMGRMLWFADEDFPVHYVGVREAHRKLLTQDDSPWRALAWPTPVRP